MILFWYGFIGFVVVMVVYEFSYGIVVRVDKFFLKFVGFVFLVVIFGVFVEFDEEEFVKVFFCLCFRVYGVGLMVNIIMVIIMVFIIIYVINLFFVFVGVEVKGIIFGFFVEKVF